ncbi:MAG: hypothetical protein LUH05_05755 [Candidatus Gastranaerophilales bacterium]|nr:hypothetical protein [Candidatus Gastranaerophilales bacterium]
MCEVTLNDMTYNARFINRHIDNDISQQGNFNFRGKNTFDACTFKFETDMSFLRKLQSITINSIGNVNLDNREVKAFEINDDNPQIVTFILI